MASIILTNWTVYYADDAGTASTGHKQIRWTGTTGTNTLNELYSELMHLFDNSDQNNADDSVPLKAVTPTLYEIGSFDAGDKEPWFIDPTSIQHLTGGGLNTTGWDRVVGSNAGIVKMGYTAGGTAPSSTDVGLTISMDTDGDSGAILYVDTANLEIWIRPDSNAIANSFDNTPNVGDTFAIATSSATGTQTAAATTGENIYSNIYSIGTIVDETEIYVTQSDALLTQWWDTGHIDILVLVSDQDSLIDNGLLRVFARQYGTLYDHFETTVATGGRNPIPLATSDDVNNDSGYALLNCSVGSGTFVEGEVIGNDNVRAGATALGVVTNVAGTTVDPDLTVYMIGDLTAFTAADTVESYSTSAQADVDTVDATAVGPKATGPAAITATFAGTQKDLNNGFGNAWYSVVIDCNSETISSVYERLKYITRRGQITDIAADVGNDIKGEQYQGIGELYIPYDLSSQDNPFTEGEIITGPNSFMGTLTAEHDRGASEGFLIIRDYSGTIPVDGNTLDGVTSIHSASVDDNAGADPVTTISPRKQAPFGTFAGGKFFGARGVYLDNLHANDANNYSLIDSEGNTQNPPSTVSTVITVKALATGLAIENARVLVWATTNDNYFYQASVSITGSGTTGTVTHTAHGLATNDYVIIQGVTNNYNYNGAFQVTVSDVNTYTYNTSGTLSPSPATGTIVSTFAFISGLTNASGVISDTRSLNLSQEVEGRIRKSSDPFPLYQQGVVSGTVDKDSGFSLTIQLASDE